MRSKKLIISYIQSMVGKYSAYGIFRDWVECSALAIQNAVTPHDELWERREQQYVNVMKKYEPSERHRFAEMFSFLVDAFDEGIEDVLGDVYMKSGCYSKQLGQFFTPFHLACLTAESSIPKDISEDKIYTVQEPSTGGGANIIALAKVLKDRGINYQKILRVTAQDLDWLAVYMSYVQFSILGIEAKVIQGNTLSEDYIQGKYPRDKVFITSKSLGCWI